jgi:hypothetical protein
MSKEILSDELGGFRNDYSTVKQMLILRLLAEEVSENQ